ncbi:MAG: hypothetical protein GF393_09125 [Armatimonadia bacterium]|nr:hypothetical protein [Armatimonadia bacterium]
MGSNLMWCTVLLLASACVAPFETDELSSTRSEALIQLPGAERASFDVFRGRQRLTYFLSVEYPAEEALSVVRSRLEAMGWEALPYNYFMPSVPTSHVTGWQQLEDVVDGVPWVVHAWSADWRNRHGDVVLYGFKYTYPVDAEPDLSRAQVFAVFFPETVAASLAASPEEGLTD